MDLATEAARRRTFAIISHPDAGKTTLTEKLLLYAGAIHLAGSVKSRKAARHAVSDWMQMEQERGISITSSVLQFDYHGSALNLLDTPGHADFSEDTYRTLAAVDSAVMLIDHAKGVEARTRKLFEVCRMRQLPIVTFMNKLDREGLSPLELIDEVSSTLNLKVAPLNWPIGMGRGFRGVVDVRTHEVTLFNVEEHGTEVATEQKLPLAEAGAILGEHVVSQVREELELLAHAGDGYDPAAFASGELSPIFWGSAMTNFGVEALLDFLAEHAAAPAPRKTEADEVLEPTSERFTGFIFKIQANMNPRHRDRIAFMRVVSGRFSRNMDVIIGRNGETLRLAKPHSFMAQERSIVDEAWPGDIVGLYDPGNLRIGDTLAEGRQLRFAGIPRFAPEFFAQLALADPLKRKALDTGLEQLGHEGVIQLFYRPKMHRQDAYLGAVGMLQFEVLVERLKNEYRVNAKLQPLPYRLARWVAGDPEGLQWLQARRDYPIVEDRNGNPVVLAESPWPLQYALKNAPGLTLHEVEPL
ncbi:MAG TPA: peptide chain release factor 3 [Myxococcota bacterium]|nr:peptide chain release factor 3 [Myxococcota bacterium]